MCAKIFFVVSSLNNGLLESLNIPSFISSLYSLADFVDDDGIKIRKDENYEKNYLLGKYGAIPTMQLFDVFKGE